MKSILHPVILRILRPLIRILHRKGVAYGEFSQLARTVYVETAEQALIHAGEKASTSRIAITTGLTRKEVAQLRQRDADLPIDTRRYNRGTRVIAGWMNDPLLQDAQGQPILLPLSGKTPSFEQLVKQHSGDMPYGAMLKELLQNGIVQLTAAGTLELLSGAYIPAGDETEQLSILGEDVNLLITTIDHNLQAAAGDRRFQRKVSYNNLPEAAVDQFRHMAREDSMALLIRFNQWLAAHDRDSNPTVEGNGQFRAGVGIYYFEEDTQT